MKRESGEFYLIFSRVVFSIAALSALTPHAAAQGASQVALLERPELFWQPLKGHASVSIYGNYSSSQYSISENSLGTQLASGSTLVTAPSFNANFAYGISDKWAYELSVGTTLTQKSVTGPPSAFNTPGTFLSSGPNDLQMAFRNSTPFEKWILHYGIYLIFSLDVNQPANSSSTGNNYSGGDGFAPYVGASWNIFGKSYLGLEASYTYRSDKVIDPDRTVADSALTSGGGTTTLLSYFEWHHRPWIFDLHAGSVWLDAESIQSTAFSYAAVVNINTTPFNYFVGAGGIQYYFSKNFTARLDGSVSAVASFNTVTTLSTTSLIDVKTQGATTNLTGELTLRNEF